MYPATANCAAVAGQMRPDASPVEDTRHASAAAVHSSPHDAWCLPDNALEQVDLGPMCRTTCRRPASQRGCFWHAGIRAEARCACS